MASKDFTSFLQSITTHSVLDASIPRNMYVALDLSISNKDLQHVDVG
jgi:hypothetical protein